MYVYVCKTIYIIILLHIYILYIIYVWKTIYIYQHVSIYTEILISYIFTLVQVLVPRAVVTKYHKLGGIKQYSLTSLEIRNLKSKCWPGPALSEGSKGKCVLCFLAASDIVSSSWHSLVYKCCTPVSASSVHTAFSLYCMSVSSDGIVLCMCLSLCLFLIRTSVR